MSKLSELKGSIPPVVTPFLNGAVDYDTYADLIEFQVANGCWKAVIPAMR